MCWAWHSSAAACSLFWQHVIQDGNNVFLCGEIGDWLTQGKTTMRMFCPLSGHNNVVKIWPCIGEVRKHMQEIISLENITYMPWQINPLKCWLNIVQDQGPENKQIFLRTMRTLQKLPTFLAMYFVLFWSFLAQIGSTVVHIVSKLTVLAFCFKSMEKWSYM